MISPRQIILVGRINVGKSTLFNRLIGTRLALTSSEPGTTRDRRDAELVWNRRHLRLVDTGGVEVPSAARNRRHATTSSQQSIVEGRSSKVNLQPLITAQTETGLKQADLALLITSAEDGVMPQDSAWADALRGKIPTLLVVNKVDNRQRELALAEFYRLGLGEPIPVAAISGRGSGDLLDVIVKKLRTAKRRSSEPSPDPSVKNAISVAIMGQPNSGKSSLLNAILGEERVVVSPMAHTTREPIDTLFRYDAKTFRLIDTAGIRRKSHVTRGVEAEGVEASLGTIERADVVALVIDVKRAPTLQDQRLASLVADRGRGLILVMNKWDLVGEKNPRTINEAERFCRDHLPGLNWAPIIFSSAKTGQRVTTILDTALAVMAARELSLNEATLTDFLKRVIKKHRPVKAGGVRHPTILSFKQVAVRPPRFEVTTRGELHPSYLKFLENRLREEFGFRGTPIRIDLKAKKKKIVR